MHNFHFHDSFLLILLLIYHYTSFLIFIFFNIFIGILWVILFSNSSIVFVWCNLLKFPWLFHYLKNESELGSLDASHTKSNKSAKLIYHWTSFAWKRVLFASFLSNIRPFHNFQCAFMWHSHRSHSAVSPKLFVQKPHFM